MHLQHPAGNLGGHVEQYMVEKVFKLEVLNWFCWKDIEKCQLYSSIIKHFGLFGRRVFVKCKQCQLYFKFQRV